MTTTTSPPRVEAHEPAPRPSTTSPRSPMGWLTSWLTSGAWLVPSAVVVATLAITANVLAMLGRGFEVTDGGNAWNLLAAPGDTPLSVTQAGHLHHVVFELLGRHEVLFQRVNVVVSLGLAIALAAVLLPPHSHPTRRDRLVDAAWAVGLGAGAFTMLAQWQGPPNYKWLAVQGLMLAAIGLVARPARSRAGEIALGVALGVGGWVAFMAKPTTGILLAVLALAHALARRSHRARVLTAVAVSTGLVLATAFALEGSPWAFVADLRAGADMTARLDPNHSLVSILEVDLPTAMSATTTWVLVATTVVAMALVRLAWADPRLAWGDPRLPRLDSVTGHQVASRTRQRGPRRVGTAGLVVVALAVAAVVVVSTTWSWWLDYGLSQGTWALAVPVAVAALLVGPARTSDGSRRDRLADLGLLLALPFAYALGSGNNYWHEGGRAAVFWLVAALPLVALLRTSPRRRRAVLATVVVLAQVITAALVHVGIRQPYRQDQSLRAMDTSLASDTPLEDVLVSPEQAAFIDGMVAGAHEAGFHAGTGVIDLSGRTPGLVHLLEAEPLGRAWLLGGFPGSIEVALRYLAAEGCATLARAWVVQGVGSEWSLAPVVPWRLGMDLHEDFRVVATEVGFDGVTRQLLAPTRTPRAATQACRASLQARGPGWLDTPLDPVAAP